MRLLRRVEPGRSLAALIVVISSLAWLTLWLAERTPAGRSLSHHNLDALRADPRLLPVFIAGWVVMVLAMMLPAQLRAMVMLRRGTRHTNSHLFGASLILGYLVVWTLLGVAIYAADWLLLQALHVSPWLRRQTWTFGALSLIVAGIYQLTPSKRAFLYSIHHGSDGSAAPGLAAPALLLGIRHGVCCVGCCWSLMLLMLGAGAGHWGWMLTLGAVMAIEKNAAWGRRLVAPFGVTLVVSGVSVLLLAASATEHAGHFH